MLGDHSVLHWITRKSESDANRAIVRLYIYEVAYSTAKQLSDSMRAAYPEQVTPTLARPLEDAAKRVGQAIG